MDDISFMKQLDNIFQSRIGFQDDYYTEEDYQELQRNLILYKEGNQEAVTYIIKMFHPFITKYSRFIVHGDIPYYTYVDKNGITHKKVSPTISMFVSLFIENDNKEERKKIFSNTCYKIKKLFSKYEYGDIYNELILALLNMANKYKIITDENNPHFKKNGTFHMYVQKCFHWEAYKYLKKLIKDPLAHFEVLRLCDQFDDIELEDGNVAEGQVFIEDNSSQILFEEMIDTTERNLRIKNANTLTLKEEKNLSAHDMDTLNFNWTNGVTCSELFKDLTPYEREILILRFIKNKSDVEIGEIYGCHRATINEHRKKAIAKIKAKALEINLIKEEK